MLNTWRTTVIEPLATAFDWLKGALKDAHAWLGTLLEAIRTANMSKIKDLIGRSPSPLAIGIQTAADAMERMARVSMPMFNAAMLSTPSMTPAYGGVGGSTYNNQRSMSANFNTTISNGMGEAEFTAKVRRVMAKEFYRGI